jgi:hypothetical protein
MAIDYWHGMAFLCKYVGLDVHTNTQAHASAQQAATQQHCILKKEEDACIVCLLLRTLRTTESLKVKPDGYYTHIQYIQLRHVINQCFDKE